MKQLIGIIQSVISDMKLLRKPFINYTLVYIGLAVISNLVSLFNSSNKAVNSFLYLVTLAVSVFQTAAIVYFQRAYIKQQIGNVVFNSIFTVILHLYFIYFIQLMIITIPVTAVMIIFTSLAVGHIFHILYYGFDRKRFGFYFSFILV